MQVEFWVSSLHWIAFRYWRFWRKHLWWSWCFKCFRGSDYVPKHLFELCGVLCQFCFLLKWCVWHLFRPLRGHCELLLLFSYLSNLLYFLKQSALWLRRNWRHCGIRPNIKVLSSAWLSSFITHNIFRFGFL